MKKIYIMCSYTGTVLSSVIRQITGIPYSHASLGLDKNMMRVYSFGRKYPRNPLIAGFVREDIRSGLYLIKKDTTCRIYEIEVSDEQYQNILNTIKYFDANKNKFFYDVSALIRIRLGLIRKQKYGFVCSQFVAYILDVSGVNIMDKDYLSVSPEDFCKLPSEYIYYEGFLREFDEKVNKL